MRNLMAVVNIHDNHNYYLTAGEKRIVIPISTMHRMCDFSGLTDSSNLIKNGAQLNIVSIETSEGTIYYPNHYFYHRLTSSACLDNERSQYVTSSGCQSIGVESESLEFKESFACIVKIRETVVAFANSGHDGSIIIGVDDYGIPKGLRDFQDIHVQKRFADDFRNQLKLLTSSLDFSQTLVFEWNEIGDKMICTIRVPRWTGDILFVHGNQLFCRRGATNQLLKGDDMVNFIVNRWRESA